MTSTSNAVSDAQRAALGNDRYPYSEYGNGWFRICYSDELEPGAVKTLQLFGQELVAYRTESGVACVIEPHCPHLGAHLGHGGAVVGESIRCPFHHWEFGTDGACTGIPYAKRIPPRARVEGWPVRECNGLVLAWHHRDGEKPDWEPPVIPELEEEGWLPLDVMHWTVRANWLDMNENCVDKVHFVYIHGALSIPPTTAEIRDHVHIATSKFRMRVPGGEADALLVTEDHGPGFQTVRITGLIDTLMINTCTPIDAEYTDVSFAYTVRAQGVERNIHLAQAVVKDLKNQFEHDRPIWENKAHWQRPVLCDGDGPISTYRKWYAQFV
jgi:phenylpropionate dioxygenase-like ring-hydroxylating dioxygenase large terminal subunit